MEDPEEELVFREWTYQDVSHFHRIKDANLISPWNSMVDRAVRLMAATLPKDEAEDPNYFADLVQHIELECLDKIEGRRAAFHNNYEQRTRGRRG